MDQSEFAPLNEASCQQPPLEQQVNTNDLAAATKSSCIDCDEIAASNNQFSPLFVPASSALEPRTPGKASFASLVERAKFLW